MDYQWPAILSSMDKFVESVPSPSDLCDLLFALRPGSVVEPGGIYFSMPSSSQRLPSQDRVNDHQAVRGIDKAADLNKKVDLVCDTLKEVVSMVPGSNSKYLTVITTAYAR